MTSGAEGVFCSMMLLSHEPKTGFLSRMSEKATNRVAGVKLFGVQQRPAVTKTEAGR